MLGGPIYWPLEQAHEVLRVAARVRAGRARRARDHDRGAPRAAAAVPASPSATARRCSGCCWCGPGISRDGARALAPLRAVGTPLGELVRPVPYRAVQSLLDGSAPRGTHAYWRSHRLPALSDAAIDRIVGLVESITSPLSLLNGWAIGGAVSRVAPGRHRRRRARGPGFELRLIAVWPPGDPDGERHRAWVRDGWETLRPYSRRPPFASFLSDEGVDGVRAAYGDRLARLTALKDRYDPANVFRLNANIPPSNGATR